MDAVGAEPVRGSFASRCVASAEQYDVAAPAQLAGDFEADAPVGAGDERDLQACRRRRSGGVHEPHARRAGSRPLRRNRRVLRRASVLERLVAQGYDRPVLYGRDPERARLGALLEAAQASRSGVLVLRGDPGIGKSALLADMRERAGDMHLLAASGVESESELPFSALHQLLRPCLGQLDRIPVAQATALRGALGLAEGARQERFLVFAGCLSLLSELAEESPVLCLVDDAHWLDAASAEALRFVARRLDAEGIVIVFAARVGEGRPLEMAGVPSLDLAGLDADAAAFVLARRAGVAAAASVRDRLLALTGGNALALVELSSVLSAAQLAGREPLPEALPLTENVEYAFLERVRRLPEPTQQVLLVAAADDSGSMSTVLRAAEALGADTAALDSAERDGLVSIRGARLEFRHPLVRSAVYQAAPSSERRAAHRALAETLAAQGDHGRRIWHVAAAAVGPDEEIARQLEEAAGHAQARGGYEAASRALERAAELSAGEAARGRRLVAAARAAMFPGPNDHAVELAQRALPLIDEPLLRAEVARVLGIEKIIRGRRLEGQRALVDAAREILPVDPKKALQLLVPSILASTEGGEVGALIEGCGLAAAADAPIEDAAARFSRHILTGIGATTRGDAARGTRLIEQALDWAITSDDLRYLVVAGVGALWTADEDEQRGAALLDAAIARARARGSLGMLGHALGLRATQLLRAERLDDALLAAHESLRLARELGYENIVPPPLSVLAMVAAIRGRDDEARALAAESIAMATASGLAFSAGSALWSLAVLDLGYAHWTQALERLNAIAEARPVSGSTSLAVLTAPDRIEAAVRAGMPRLAHDALQCFETWAEQSHARWARPLVASCRALLSEGDEATRHFQEAVAVREQARPFDLARIQLLYGEHLRRQRHRVEARTQLRGALGEFERVRAVPWAERARAELRAAGETVRRPEPSRRSQLTPQELHAARLVAQGLSNKEVGAKLFLSPRTIDFHLRNVFRKLDISSRTQLAGLHLGDDTPLSERTEAAVRA